MRLPSVREALAEAAHRLAAEGIEDARHDAVLLLCDATGADKAKLLGHPERVLLPGEERSFTQSIQRRTRREPLQYIRGVQEFWGLPVAVGPGCLIPRPETEHLVEEAVRLVRDVSSPCIAEIGPGSGCVLMALAKELPTATIIGVDREEGALAWARRNLVHTPRVALGRGDFSEGCPLRNLHLLLSNPPYITQEEWPTLQAEVRDFEPAAALLVEGRDPLGPYRALARWAESALLPGGHLLCELGVAQARRARALRTLSPHLAWVEGVRDLAGRLRVAIWRRVR